MIKFTLFKLKLSFQVLDYFNSNHYFAYFSFTYWSFTAHRPVVTIEIEVLLKTSIYNLTSL